MKPISLWPSLDFPSGDVFFKRWFIPIVVSEDCLCDIKVWKVCCTLCCLAFPCVFNCIWGFTKHKDSAFAAHTKAHDFANCSPHSISENFIHSLFVLGLCYCGAVSNREGDLSLNVPVCLLRGIVAVCLQSSRVPALYRKTSESTFLKGTTSRGQR